MTTPPPGLDGLRIQRESKPSSRFSGLTFALVAIVVVLVGAGVWWTMRPRAIEVHTVTVQELATTGGDHTVLNASGYVTARREATVSSKVTGKVDDVMVEEGMNVTENQILARIDATNVKASLELAQAQAKAAHTALEETRVRLVEAEQELERQTALRRGDVAAQADLDHATAAASAFRARLDQQQAEATVAERTVAVYQQQMDDTVIRAPFGGTVTSKNAQPGEMISPMSTGGFTRTGICTIVDMSSLEIEIDVNESYINRVEAGQPVEATLDAYPDWKIPCHVIAIIPTADRNKSTVKVRIGFNKLDPRILPDMSAKVAFRETRESAAAIRHGVMVPKAAINQQGDHAIVMVMHGDTAERRAVVIDSTDGDAALVTSGLSAGERVIVNAPAGLADGAHIKESSP